MQLLVLKIENGFSRQQATSVMAKDCGCHYLEANGRTQRESVTEEEKKELPLGV